MSVPALIIDIGGGSLKVGFAGDERPKIIDNCIFKSRTLSGRTFIGDEIDDCENLSSLYYIMPFKKGYLNDWDVQTRILDNVLSRLFKQVRAPVYSSIPVRNDRSTSTHFQIAICLSLSLISTFMRRKKL